MKFGTEYEAALRREEYPAQWLDSAISYKKLKKCIKRVRQELLSFRLDRETLEALWQHVGTDAFSQGREADADRMMHYQFLTDEGARFVPRLTVALDPSDGSPMDAWLSPQTKHILQKIGTHKQRRSSRRPSETPTQINGSSDVHRSSVTTIDADHDSGESSPDRVNGKESNHQSDPPPILTRTNTSSTTELDPIAEKEVETIEIPLTSDSEFFQILKKELQALEKLQDSEQEVITTDIDTLSNDLQVLKHSRSKRSRAELNIWREIFRLYIESDIFMSNHEHDAGTRSAEKAAYFFNQFTKQLGNVNTNPPAPKSKEAHIALDRFLTINTTLLRLLKFQELNRRALGKILKKFDKQTSLHAISNTTPEQMMSTLTLHPNKPGLNPHDLARSTAYAISTSLLSIIPQLDDYLCPICCMITYKPIRLRCNHVFCVRCMIKLQRASKDECPLCRERTVIEATEFNMDENLKKFLKKEFPDDVLEKKKDNELQAGKELFGEEYQGTHKCTVM